jgi:hypothetical protein
LKASKCNGADKIVFCSSQPWIAPPDLVGRASHLLCVFLSSSCKSRLKVIDFFLSFFDVLCFCASSFWI